MFTNNDGDIDGDLGGDIDGDLGGDIDGDLGGDIDGDLGGDIDGDLDGILSQLFLRQVGLCQSSWLELDLLLVCEMGGDLDGVLACEIGLEEDDDQLGLRPSNEIGL